MRIHPKYVAASGVAAAVLGASLAFSGGEGEPDEVEIIARTGEYGRGLGSQPSATNGRGKVENLNADMVDSTDVHPIMVRVLPGGRTPRLAQSGSLRLAMSCGNDGDVTVTAVTDENGIIHGLANGIGEDQQDWEGKDDTFAAGETFTTGFDQSHSGFIRYLDDDEAITIDLSTNEQGGAQPLCAAFGTILGGPHVRAASTAHPG